MCCHSSRSDKDDSCIGRNREMTGESGSMQKPGEASRYVNHSVSRLVRSDSHVTEELRNGQPCGEVADQGNGFKPTEHNDERLILGYNISRVNKYLRCLVVEIVAAARQFYAPVDKAPVVDLGALVHTCRIIAVQQCAERGAHPRSDSGDQTKGQLIRDHY